MSTGTTNLDISTVDTEDYEELAKKINSYYKTDSSVKTQLAWNWDRNHLMLDGKQWIQFNGNNQIGGQWDRLRVSKANEFIPRPVTNYIFDIYQTLKSYLIKNKPRSKVYPNDPNSYRDKMSSRLANLVLEANWVRLKEQYNYEMAAASLITYGTVFKKSYWDTSSLSMIKVPKMKKTPITDPMTGQVLGETESQDVDPVTKDPLFEHLPLGDMNTSVIEPHRMALDPLAVNLHEAKWIMEYSIQTIDWVKETYDREGEGFTGEAADLQEDKDLNGSMKRWFQLRTTSGVKGNNLLGSASGASTSDSMVENSVVVKEYYERPSAESPKGRLVVVAGDVCVFSGDSPYEGPEMGDWHPYSECRWEMVPGRFWGKSPLDDATEIQKHINSIDSVIILTRKTTAVPQKLIPMGSGVAPGTWTGRPGQEVAYRADGTGSKPEILPPSDVGQQVFAERAQRVDDIKAITGAIDILKGDRPPGVNAASALNLLYEVGTGKLFPILDRWKSFVEQDQKKQLRVIGKFYKEPRPEFIRLIRSKNTDLAEEDINQFIGTDLNDNCNVIIEAGSNIPKLQAAKQSMLMELAQLGMLNLQNPSNRVQFQQDLGIMGYDSDIEPDRKRAMWENDLLDNLMYSPDNKPVVLAVDNHDLHKEEHEARMKSPNFMALPIEIQHAYMQHIQEHEQFEAQAQQAQMLQQQAMGPQQTPPGPKPGQAAAGAAAGAPQGVGPGKGKGMPKAMKQAVMGADILTPATLGSNR